MNILMLNYEFPPLGGGTGNANYYLLKEFRKFHNLKIDLVTSSVSEFSIEEFSSNITVHYIDIGKKDNLLDQTKKDLLIYSWKAYRYTKKLMTEKVFDGIHSFFGIPCGYIAMKLKLPYIVSLRGSDVPFHNPRFEKLDRFFFQNLSKKIWDKAKFVVVNSEGLEKEALITSSEQKFYIIYNGIDTKEFVPVDKKRMNDKIILISAGRLSQVKGHEYLIRALKGLDGFELILIGDGDQKEFLENLSVEIGVKVVFLGLKNHKEIPYLLQKADVFVLPSLNEGMSNALLEAMACGLSVIVTDVGGSSELIKGNGFLVKKGSVEAIREALIEYKEDKKLIRKYGKKSRELAEAMSWKKSAEEYYEIYEKSFL